MSDDLRGPACAAVEENLAELALGVLTGRERSLALNHVSECPRCAAELDELSTLADALLHHAPEADPPVGFELRLARRLQGHEAPRRFTRPRTLVALAAAMLLLLGVGIGWLAIPRSGSSAGGIATLTAAPLVAGGHSVGEVIVSPGSPAWMFMTLDSGTRSITVWCSVRLADGSVETVGQFRLTAGYGSWGAPISASPAEVRSAEVIGPNETVLASATLTR